MSRARLVVSRAVPGDVLFTVIATERGKVVVQVGGGQRELTVAQARRFAEALQAATDRARQNAEESGRWDQS